MIASSDVDEFGSVEVELLKETAADVSIGLEILRARSDNERLALQQSNHESLLRASLEDALKAMAMTIEKRDPYTAGHQHRVADLARALADELHINEDEAHGIYLAGIVHDIGKIQVPAEMLVKPGRLSEIEYSLMKFHAEASYEILKGVNFPWPIAEMARQHHERMDGTGYPQGLQGGDILVGSRILAVADVVEAMSSHRPYRPSLGIEAALNEIEKGSGTLYDPAVVKACLQIFSEGRFKF